MTKSVCYRAAEEAEERVRDCRDKYRDRSDQCRLRCAIRHERESNQCDGVAEAADDLARPEKGEIRRAEPSFSCGFRGRLQDLLKQLRFPQRLAAAIPEHEVVRCGTLRSKTMFPEPREC